MDESIKMPLAKVGTSIGTAAVVKAEEIKNAAENTLVSADFFTLSWSNVAAALAAAYTLSMLIEFWWKKFWRPFLIRKGWLQLETRIVLTEEEMAEVERRRRVRERDTVL